MNLLKMIKWKIMMMIVINKMINQIINRINNYNNQ